MAAGKFCEDHVLNPDGSINACGPFELADGDDIKWFSVRICQKEGAAERHLRGTPPIDDDGNWNLTLNENRKPGLDVGDATATAVLAWTDAQGDLFSLTWADCVMLGGGAARSS
jgi:hypothetical protein